MGTREVYEQKLRSGNLHHDPTMNPGLGTPRCPRCLSLLAHDSDKGEWTITPVLHDATAVVIHFPSLLNSPWHPIMLPQVPHITGFHFLLDTSKRLTLPALGKKGSDDFLQVHISKNLLQFCN